MIYIKLYAETLFEISKMLGLIFLIMAFFINVSGAQFFVYLTIVSSFVGPASMYLYGRSE